MKLNINQIRESGILELYVLDDLSAKERIDVEQYLQEFPDLKTDILEIEASLFHYANEYSIPPGSELLDKIKKELEFTKPTSQSASSSAESKNSSIFSTALGLGILLASIATSIFFYTSNNELKKSLSEKETLIDDCEELKNRSNQQLAILNHIGASKTNPVLIEATPKYPETELIIYTNDESKKNIIQIKNLPRLASNQSFQLWSLGDDGPPKPMDVFDNTTTQFITSGYIDSSTAYAITIEAKGGAQTPNLDNLIGVFKLG